MHPILLQYLFVNVGFAWGVRISGFVTLVLCITATATVTSRTRRARKESADEPSSNMHALRDPPFALLVVGSCFMSLGESSMVDGQTPRSDLTVLFAVMSVV